MTGSRKAYLEVWLKGHANAELKRLSPNADERYHPHVTLLRPFTFDHEDSALVMCLITDYCRGKEPIRFGLKGMEQFNTGEIYIPVVGAKTLTKFSDGLERTLSPYVRLAPKPEPKTNLHATIKTDSSLTLDDLKSCQKIDECMLRLTAISDGLVWFSYDFVRQESISRRWSLDEDYWRGTVLLFQGKTGLVSTENGFKKIK